MSRLVSRLQIAPRKARRRDVLLGWVPRGGRGRELRLPVGRQVLDVHVGDLCANVTLAPTTVGGAPLVKGFDHDALLVVDRPGGGGR